jgi:hypothetical protein
LFFLLRLENAHNDVKLPSANGMKICFCDYFLAKPINNIGRGIK